MVRILRDLDDLGFHVSMNTARTWMKKFKTDELHRTHEAARGRAEEDSVA